LSNISNKTPPDRIRGFTSLADHQAATYEGKIVESEIDGYKLRRTWFRGEWWHSVADVAGALAETSAKDATAYWRKLKQRLEKQEGFSEVVTLCHELKLPALDGKMRLADCAPNSVIFRVIQSIPSQRAEPIKRFLAEVAAQRLEEIAQPSKAIDRAIQSYRDQGRDEEWVDGRLQNISGRNELTDEWKDRGAADKMGILTNDMSKEMLGVTIAEHRDMKGLEKKHELREQMDNLELAVVTLGERAAKAIIVAQDTKTYEKTRKATMTGAKVAGDAARRIEEEIGRKIANKDNFLALADMETKPALANETKIPVPKKKPEKTLTQPEKFEEAARELGCNEDESAFDEMIKEVAKAPPPRQNEKAKPKRKPYK